VVNSPAALAKEYQVGLELRDLIWIEMILVERKLYRSFALKDGTNPRGLREAVHALKALSLRIAYGLEYFEDLARANHYKLDFEGIIKSRHKSYHETHPFTLIRPYLNPAMLHIYLDLYPGLDEMEIAIPEIRGAFNST